MIRCLTNELHETTDHSNWLWRAQCFENKTVCGVLCAVYALMYVLLYNIYKQFGIFETFDLPLHGTQIHRNSVSDRVEEEEIYTTKTYASDFKAHGYIVIVFVSLSTFFFLYQHYRCAAQSFRFRLKRFFCIVHHILLF